MNTDMSIYIKRMLLTLCKDFASKKEEIIYSLDKILDSKMRRFDGDTAGYAHNVAFNIVLYKSIIKRCETLFDASIKSKNILDEEELEKCIKDIVLKSRKYVFEAMETDEMLLTEKDQKIVDMFYFENIDGFDDDLLDEMSKKYKTLNLYKAIFIEFLKKISVDREKSILMDFKSVDTHLLKLEIMKVISSEINSILVYDEDELLADLEIVEENGVESRLKRSDFFEYIGKLTREEMIIKCNDEFDKHLKHINISEDEAYGLSVENDKKLLVFVLMRDFLKNGQREYLKLKLQSLVEGTVSESKFLKQMEYFAFKYTFLNVNYWHRVIDKLSVVVDISDVKFFKVGIKTDSAVDVKYFLKNDIEVNVEKTLSGSGYFSEKFVLDLMSKTKNKFSEIGQRLKNLINKDDEIEASEDDEYDEIEENIEDISEDAYEEDLKYDRYGNIISTEVKYGFDSAKAYNDSIDDVNSDEDLSLAKTRRVDVKRINEVLTKASNETQLEKNISKEIQKNEVENEDSSNEDVVKEFDKTDVNIIEGDKFEAHIFEELETLKAQKYEKQDLDRIHKKVDTYRTAVSETVREDEEIETPINADGTYSFKFKQLESKEETEGKIETEVDDFQKNISTELVDEIKKDENVSENGIKQNLKNSILAKFRKSNDELEKQNNGLKQNDELEKNNNELKQNDELEKNNNDIKTKFNLGKNMFDSFKKIDTDEEDGGYGKKEMLRDFVIAILLVLIVSVGYLSFIKNYNRPTVEETNKSVQMKKEQSVNAVENTDNTSNASLNEASNMSKSEAEKVAKEAQESKEKEARDSEVRKLNEEADAVKDDDMGKYYTIYGGALADKESANKIADSYRSKGVGCKVERNAGYYMIRIGNYNNYSYANQMSVDLTSKGIQNYPMAKYKYFDLKLQAFELNAEGLSKEQLETDYNDLKNQIISSGKTSGYLKNLDEIYKKH